VKYVDHVLFKKTNPYTQKPCVREAVGWLRGETNEVLCLCHDRAIEPLPFEKPSESGCIILKSDVLEKREIE